MTIRRPTRLLDFPYIGLYRYSLRFATYGRDRHFIADDPVAAARTEKIALRFLGTASCPIMCTW